MTTLSAIESLESSFIEPEFEKDSILIQIDAVAAGFFLGKKALESDEDLTQSAASELRSRVCKIYLKMSERIAAYSALARIAISCVLWMMGVDLKGAFDALEKALSQKAFPLHAPSESNAFDPSRFPADFKWGAGTCEYQLSGAEHCSHNQWVDWEEKYVAEACRSKTATDHWVRYVEDVQLLKNLGINSYRFSVEWSEIEPSQGQYNQAAIDHYKDLCQRLLDAGIEPCVTLHHFTHPQWFEDIGAFEKEENIAHIVRFTEKMVGELDGVKTWFTINEPNVYAAMGYHSGIIGHFPPAGNYRYQKMFEVYANLLRAHDRMYDAIKNTAKGETQVGIVHQMLEFEPAGSLESPIASYMTWVFMSRPFVHFMRTGEFRMQVPGLVNVSYVSDKPRGDFIGINYYTRPLIDFFAEGQMGARENEVITDMGFRTHPAGLYKWLCELHSIGLPLIITENGIADADDSRRGRFIEQQLLAIQKAIEAGVNLQGYFHWAAFDNAEWEHGVGPKRFGLYAVDFDTKERRLREGARAYIDAIRAWHDQKEAVAI